MVAFVLATSPLPHTLTGCHMSLIQNATQQPGIVNADEYHYHAQHSPMIASFSSSFLERGPQSPQSIACSPAYLPVCLLTIHNRPHWHLTIQLLSRPAVHRTIVAVRTSRLQHSTGSRQAAGDKNRLMQATTGLVDDIKRESLSKSTSRTGNHRESVYPPSLTLSVFLSVDVGVRPSLRSNKNARHHSHSPSTCTIVIGTLGVDSKLQINKSGEDSSTRMTASNVGLRHASDRCIMTALGGCNAELVAPPVSDSRRRLGQFRHGEQTARKDFVVIG